jgi:hypothetical protein
MASLHDVEVMNFNSGAKTADAVGGAQAPSHPFDPALGISTRATARPNPVGRVSAGIDVEHQDLWRGNSEMTDKGDLGEVPDASMISLFRGLVNFLVDESRKRGWEDISASLHQVEAVIASRVARRPDSN